MATVQLEIKKQAFYNNGELILEHITENRPDTDNSTKKRLLRYAIELWLNQQYEFAEKKHTTKLKSWNGYNATDINIKLREKMHSIAGIHGETHIVYGALFHDTKEGFDFSLYDEENNYIKIRNSYIGTPGILNGEEKIKTVHKALRKKDNDKKKMPKKEWEDILNSIPTPIGENTPEKKSSFTVVGEIQFGNWALAEHDLLRLIHSSVNKSIDYYIYITPTGKLADCLSDGIVTYDKINQHISLNAQSLSVPMWIIGLDIT